MISIDFISPLSSGPRVWIDTKEVTNQCISLELLPAARARVRLIVVPHVVDYRSEDSGFGIGIREGSLRKQVHEDSYIVLSCPDCSGEVA
jgi:hypothetical protein